MIGEEINDNEQNVLLAERERQRIAQELHDGIQQKLAGIALLVNAKIENDDQVGLIPVHDLLKECISDIRKISHNLKLDDIENVSLCDLMKKVIKDLSHQTGLKIHFNCEENITFPYWQKINLFRITQELLTNTIKHAHAEYVEINLNITENGFVYSYKDDGTGMPKIVKEGMGLKNIRNRTHSMNGIMSIPFALGFALKIIFPSA